MMNGSPYMLYALSQIHQHELERKARTAWQRGTTPETPAPRRQRTRAVTLETVADGC
jgi:hypothetical protein